MIQSATFKLFRGSIDGGMQTTVASPCETLPHAGCIWYTSTSTSTR